MDWLQQTCRREQAADRVGQHDCQFRRHARIARYFEHLWTRLILVPGRGDSFPPRGHRRLAHICLRAVQDAHGAFCSHSRIPWLARSDCTGAAPVAHRVSFLFRISFLNLLVSLLQLPSTNPDLVGQLCGRLFAPEARIQSRYGAPARELCTQSSTSTSTSTATAAVSAHILSISAAGAQSSLHAPNSHTHASH